MVSVLLAGWLAGCEGSDPSASSPPTDTYKLGIKIASETTRITEPLLANGTPDYAAAMNVATGMGVTPVNNAVQELAPVAGLQLSERIRNRLDLAPKEKSLEERLIGGFARDEFEEYARRRTAPGAAILLDAGYEAFVAEQKTLDDGYCTTLTCPAIAGWVRANEGALAAVARAVKKPRYWVPIEEGTNLYRASAPDLRRLRNACVALRARAELRLGDGSRAAAYEDILTLHKLAVLVGQSSRLSDQVVAADCIGEGNDVLRRVATDPEIDVEASKPLARELEALPQIGNFELVVQRERFSALAEVFLLRELIDREGTEAWKEVLEGADGEPRAAALYRLNVSSLDWNLAMALVNLSWDLARELTWSANREDWERARERFHDELRFTAETAHTLEEPRLGELLGNVDRDPQARPTLTRAFVDAAGLLAPDLTGFLREVNEPLADRDLGILALALASHRRETGALPEAIDSLVPDYLERIPPATQFGYVMRVSRGSSSGLALTLVPVVANMTGSRSYCVDSEGRNVILPDGREPVVIEGRCEDSES